MDGRVTVAETDGGGHPRNESETGLLQALLEWKVYHTTDGITFPVEEGLTFTPIASCMTYWMSGSPLGAASTTASTGIASST